MSNRKLAKAIQQLFKQIWKLYRSLSKGFVTWLLRTALLPSRRRATAGFVLPTTVLLVLVVTLTSGALSYRAFNNSSRIIGNVQSKAIYNAATPAVDRARAKLDYLFGKDTRLPGGVPAEEFMISMMLNDGRTINGQTAPARNVDVPGSVPGDPYTLVGETRVDVNNDGQLDNSWVYGDPGTGNSVIYSINMSTPDDPAGTPANAQLGAYRLLNLRDSEKATGDDGGPFVRSGPLSNNKAVKCPGTGGKIEQGWYEDAVDTSILRKRFQVNAFVVNPDDVAKNRSNFATLEFSQDRQLDRGNKWGAWFRYDMEIHPGTAAPMNWNGAMHSEGNIIIGNEAFNSFLISSPESCVFLPRSNSQVSVREFTEQLGDPTRNFKGVIAAGLVGGNNYSGSTGMHVYQNNSYDSSPRLTPGDDWATESKSLIGITSDPVAILTDDLQQARLPDVNNTGARLADPKQEDGTFYDRRFEVEQKNTRPYLDDTYRADNRWGPKVQYTPNLDEAGLPKDRIPAGNVVGDRITGQDELTRSGGAGQEPGLDGYWERRTFADSALDDRVYTGGMRILVGERLELGNPFGWVAPQNREGTQDPSQPPNTATTSIEPDPAQGDNSDIEGDPLNPPYRYLEAPRAHEAKQRRALRDNLAAVQASAIYHYRLGNGGQYPAACLVTTSHPGTPQTLAQSVNFTQPNNVTFGAATIDSRFDFFTGKGTNGWEFDMPQSVFDGPAMQTALQNLANFAGDPEGAFPPVQEAGAIHPDPAMTMFGNFSNLRRALATPAADRSPADLSYMHTAACTLGALAYNINEIQRFNPSDTSLQTDLYDLALELVPLMDGVAEEGDSPSDEVLPRKQLETYGYPETGPGTFSVADYNPRDYDLVTPDMWLAALKRRILQITGVTDIEQAPNYRLYRLAELIHESYQIRRDRTYGFRPSPAANTWNFNPYMTVYSYDPDGSGTNFFKPTLWSSACDPYIFNLTGSAGSGIAASENPTQEEARQRLALSRLCGSVIPSGAMHDYPGDGNYPARGAAGSSDFLPKSTTAQAQLDDLVDDLSNGVSPNAVFTTAGNPLNTPPYSQERYRYASVAPKFPALYYVFPEFAHGQLGADELATNGDHRQPGAVETSVPAAVQPWVEPYVVASNAINSATAPTYQPVSNTNGLGASENYPAGGTSTPVPFSLRQPDGTEINLTGFNYKAASVFPTPDRLAGLGVSPRANLASWTLPNNATVSVPQTADTASPNLIRYGLPDTSTIGAVPFLDRVLFDGRQWLPNRVLDIDLNMLRSTSPAGASDENWLPVSGIVYAFREDARREDAINRPANTLGFTDAQNPANETDPAIRTDKFNISTKSIDFIPDPDRRDHGFRLRNGATLRRTAAGIPGDKNVRGITFVSDNSAYVLGNFNVHNSGDNGSGDRLEEFTAKLPNNPVYTDAEFYDNRTTIDDRFADRDEDFWRPSEILSDSVTILSKDFCDGSAIDTFNTAGRINDATVDASVYNNQARALFGLGCTGTKPTSFLNQNRPNGEVNAPFRWARENPSDALSPVKVSRNGNGLITNGSLPIEYGSINDPQRTNHNYATLLDVDGTLDRSRSLQIPYGTRGAEDVTNVNAIIVSGIIPSRELQAYGGMHNFPRLLEFWEARPLRIAGSFLQLNFSNYATAPQDQEVWEPNAAKSITPTQSDDMIDYYGFAPDRLWGYDVALKLAPASPAAARFTTPSTERNEFYEEPKVNDPYMQRLCAALKATPSASVTTLNCPI